MKARFDRLVNIGFIKSVSPILDFTKIDYSDNLAVNNITLPSLTKLKTKEKTPLSKIEKGIGILCPPWI